jgi:hypothetical protein
MKNPHQLFRFLSINIRFGIPLVRRDSELLQLLTSEEHKEFSWFMMSQIGKHSYLYATGWPKYKWYQQMIISLSKFISKTMSIKPLIRCNFESFSSLAR